MNATAIPFFSAEEMSGVADVLHEKLTMHPLRAYFPRIVHDSDSIELRVRVWKSYAADGVGWNEPSPLSQGHDVRIVTAQPIQLREARRLENDEISFFRRYDQLKQSGGLQGTHEQRRAEKLVDITRETMLPVNERAHIMMAEALRGSATVRIAGIDTTIDYGLNTLPGPSGNDWDNAAAPIVTDFYKNFRAFEDHANVPCDTVFCSPHIFDEYLVNNTQFTTYVKENPALAAQFIGMGEGGQGFSLFEPRAPFRLFGRTFVPVWGKYTDRSGNSVDRWPVNKLTLAALNAGDGQRVLEHAATRDEYCPQGEMAFRTWQEHNPISYLTEAADNIIPVIRIAERVQVMTVES